MALCSSRKLAAALVSLVLILSVRLMAEQKAAGKMQQVDAGTFAVLVNGQQVASETFRIEQGPAVNTINSEFRAEQGQKTVLKTTLEITPAGDLRHYEWQELDPAKSHIVVEPSDQFLLEHITPAPPAKPSLQSFLLPPATAVLDDYFFSHREVLAWRYLAQVCGGNLQQCHPGKTQFGVLVPQQRSALTATLEYVGPEKVMVRGSQLELNRINLQVADDPEWILYLDGNFKLVQISIPAEKTEVVRQ